MRRIVDLVPVFVDEDGATDGYRDLVAHERVEDLLVCGTPFAKEGARVEKDERESLELHGGQLGICLADKVLIIPMTEIVH